MPGADPNVTIIILTKNGEGYLNEVLARLFAQKIYYHISIQKILHNSTVFLRDRLFLFTSGKSTISP